MPVARKRVVDLKNPGSYHCISRTCRQLFLCGKGIRDRKQWLHNRLIELAETFTIDVSAHAFLDDHFHTVLDTHPEEAAELAAGEVAERWFKVYPKSIHRWAKSWAGRHDDLKNERDADGKLTDHAAVQIVARDEHQVEMLRQRLSNLSWLMKILKQELAIIANKEEDVTGHFWQGRFKAIRILDDAARFQVMIYVDLNLIRAAMAKTPEDSDHTSVQDRIKVKKAMNSGAYEQKKRPPELAVLLRKGKAGNGVNASDPDHGSWLSPIQKTLNIMLNQYLKAVDEFGRVIRPGKRGAIAADLPPILERLGLTEADLELAASKTDNLWGSVAGSRASCAAEATRRGARNVVSVFRPNAKKRADAAAGV